MQRVSGSSSTGSPFPRAMRRRPSRARHRPSRARRPARGAGVASAPRPALAKQGSQAIDARKLPDKFSLKMGGRPARAGFARAPRERVVLRDLQNRLNCWVGGRMMILLKDNYVFIYNKGVGGWMMRRRPCSRCGRGRTKRTRASRPRWTRWRRRSERRSGSRRRRGGGARRRGRPRAA